MPTTTNASDLQHDSPFMRLPPELRIEIYLHALQTTIASISSSSFPSTSPNDPSDQNNQPIVGSLALLFTSSAIRAESSDAMRVPANTLCDQFVARTDAHRAQQLHDAFVHGQGAVDEDVDEEWNDNRERRELMLCANRIISTAYLYSLLEVYARGLSGCGVVRDAES
jgi:hypothetical protein